MTIEMILSAFEELRDEKGIPDDPLQVSIIRLFDEAGDEGLTAPELVQALLGREIEEENLVLVQTQPAEGHG